MELTEKQEEIMLEDGRNCDYDKKEIILQEYEKDIDVGFVKCEICCEKFLDVDIRNATIDDNEENVCVYCLENLQD